MTAVGLKTCRFRVGDRVAFNLSSSLATTIIVPESLCADIPHAMTFEEAASYPYSYSTVLYGLMELGRLRKDQVGSSCRDKHIITQATADSLDSSDSFDARCSWSSCYPSRKNGRCRGKLYTSILAQTNSG